jgi:hypothetical protein
MLLLILGFFKFFFFFFNSCPSLWVEDVSFFLDLLG